MSSCTKAYLFKDIYMNSKENIIYQIYRPSPDLAHLVSYYFLYENSAATSRQEFALSDGNPGISFALQQPYTLLSADNTHLGFSQAFVCGAFTKGIYVNKSSFPQKMFGVKLMTDGLHSLLQLPLSGLREKPIWHLESLIGSRAAVLADRIIELPEISQKIYILESFLRKNMHICKKPERRFREAVMLIRQSRGQLPIEQVAKRLSLNYKWLERKFIDYTGTTPKEFSRLVRFIYTYFHFKRTGITALLDIAIENGYYDQNHFIKDFKHFTGYTPTQLQQAPVYDLASIMEPLNKINNGS